MDKFEEQLMEAMLAPLDPDYEDSEFTGCFRFKVPPRETEGILMIPEQIDG